MNFTLIFAYYRNPAMLARQACEWLSYPAGVRVLVVDDGSPWTDEADRVLPRDCRAELYRITKDTPWNRNGARNLGATFAATDWILHADIDHVLPVSSAEKLVTRELNDLRWYRFARWRLGRADATRRKDKLADDCEFGPIRPHVDSFLSTRAAYWRAGGYDEDYSGSIGGSAPFLGWMKKCGGEAEVLDDVPLHVYTTTEIPDASDVHLSRSRERYEALRVEKKAAGDPKPTTHLRFPWVRVR